MALNGDAASPSITTTTTANNNISSDIDISAKKRKREDGLADDNTSTLRNKQFQTDLLEVLERYAPAMSLQFPQKTNIPQT